MNDVDDTYDNNDEENIKTVYIVLNHSPRLTSIDFRRGYSTGRTKLGPALNNFCIRLNTLLFYITAESKCQVLDYQGSCNRQ